MGKINLSYIDEWNVVKKNNRFINTQTPYVINESKEFKYFMDRNDIQNIDDLIRFDIAEHDFNNRKSDSIKDALISDEEFKELALNYCKDNDDVNPLNFLTLKNMTPGIIHFFHVLNVGIKLL